MFQAHPHVHIDIAFPWRISFGAITLALEGIARYKREVFGPGKNSPGDDDAWFFALMQVILAVGRSGGVPGDDEIALVRITFPDDLPIEALLLAEQSLERLAGHVHVYQLRAITQVVRVLLAAYRWEVGDGPAPEPVIPAGLCSELSYTSVQEYLAVRWTNGGQRAHLSAEALAELAEHHFGIHFEPGDSLFLLMAQETIRFGGQVTESEGDA